MSASQPSPERSPQPRPLGAPKLAAEPATLRGGIQKAEPRMPRKCIPPPGYDPSRDSMDTAGQAYELILHVDTFRKRIKAGLGPPFFINADGSYLFSRKATAAWLEQRRCRNLLDAARIRREDRTMRDSRAKEAGNA